MWQLLGGNLTMLSKPRALFLPQLQAHLQMFGTGPKCFRRCFRQTCAAWNFFAPRASSSAIGRQGERTSPRKNIETAVNAAVTAGFMGSDCQRWIPQRLQTWRHRAGLCKFFWTPKIITGTWGKKSFVGKIAKKKEIDIGMHFICKTTINSCSNNGGLTRYKHLTCMADTQTHTHKCVFVCVCKYECVYVDMFFVIFAFKNDFDSLASCDKTATFLAVKTKRASSNKSNLAVPNPTGGSSGFPLSSAGTLASFNFPSWC